MLRCAPSKKLLTNGNMEMVVNSSGGHNLNVTTKELSIRSVEFHSEEHLVMGPGALKIILLALLLLSDVVKGRK